jgi:hypothetical protein
MPINSAQHYGKVGEELVQKRCRRKLWRLPVLVVPAGGNEPLPTVGLYGAERFHTLLRAAAVVQAWLL